ncbi:TetR/AcrR family transcriptional regulator [Nocardia jiangxiensis]|uniref:TetR/AcrR family transcriptional regulator n=1 Tax=Nocardia jiangxiensis TaxID=282685 RepID=A0ABW6RZH3_9NOCA
MTDTVREDMRSQRRAARRAEAISDVLDAAERVFGEDGLRDGSLRRIADLSGYSTAAMYKFFDSKHDLVAQTLSRRADEYLAELRRTAESEGTALERLHRVVDTAAVYFRARPDFRSVLRQVQGGSAIIGPVLAAFADDVYGRFAQAMNLMADLIGEGQETGEIRAGKPAALAHLASVLINEFALADADLTAEDFHAVFDGALRAPAASHGPGH